MNMISMLTTVALAVAGCGLFETYPEKDGVEPMDQLRLRYQEQKEALGAASDPATGWPSSTDCDGTLWAGLACAGGAPVNVELAEYAPGIVHRRPVSVGACWTPEAGDLGSKSTVSQDMLTGYVWCLWRSSNVAATQRLAAAGEARPEVVLGQTVGWVLGEPYPQMAEAVVLRPNLIGAVGRMLYTFSAGADSRSYRNYPALYPPTSIDYAQHLQALGIVLQGEIDTATREAGLLALDIDGHMLARLREFAEAHPEDALFQASLGVYTGDYARATELLLDPNYAAPSYVRGASAAYALVHWLFAADLVLRHNGGAP